MTYDKYQQWAQRPVALDPALSIVIPAYNESRRIVPTIASIAAEMSAHELDFEIVVSDDGSTDDTAQLVRNLGLRNVIVLDPGINRGKGAAVRAGVNAARGRLILFSDADMSTPMQEYAGLRDAIEGGADVAIGSRAAEGSVVNAKSRLRSLLSWGWRRFTRVGLGLDIADTQCGFKLFRRDAARALFSAGRIDGFSFDAEVLYLAARFDMHVKEVAVDWFDAPGSKVRPGRVAMQFVRDLVRIRFNALVGRYPSTPSAAPSRGMRVAIVTAVPPSDSTLTEYGHHLVHQLAKKSEIDEVIVFAEDSNGLPITPKDGVVYRAAWTFDSPFSPLRIIRQVRRDRPDVVFFNAHFTSFGSKKIPAALGLLTPAFVRLTGAKSIVLLHNIVDTVDLDQAGFGAGKIVNRILIGIGRLLTRALLRAHVVVTTMPAYVDILREKYGATNVFLTPHGTFDDPIAAAPQATNETLQVLAFGKFGTYKRVDDLVAAHRLLLERGYDVECVIAGTDSPNAKGYLAGVAADNVDVSGLHFTGYVEESDIEGLFTNAALVVFPYTSTTGSSGPLHQTGSYARAAVAPRLGDFVDLIEKEGFCVQQFEPGDVESLADAMAVLLDDPLLRDEMGRRNFAAATSLPLAHVADWHVAHFEALLAA